MIKLLKKGLRQSKIRNSNWAESARCSLKRSAKNGIFSMLIENEGKSNKIGIQRSIVGFQAAKERRRLLAMIFIVQQED